MKIFYTRLSDAEKPAKIALLAVMGKLLILLNNIILNNNQQKITTIH